MYEEGQNPVNVKEQVVGRRFTADPSIHKWLFNPKDIILEVEKFMKGEIYDRRTHTWVQKRKPLMNEDGINSILLLVSPYASKVFSMSHFSDARIKKMSYEFGCDLIILIGTDLENDFDFDEKQMSVVVRLITNIVYSTLRKAIEGLSLGILRDTTQSREVYGKESGGGIMSIFKKWRKS